jgi:hypothetical protein
VTATTETFDGYADDWTDGLFDVDAAPGTPGGYAGPGTAGARWCACGESVSWPDGTTADDRGVLQDIQDAHEDTCPVMHPELVQPSHATAPSPTAVAQLHARRRADLDAGATETVRRALRMISRLRAVGLTPGSTARITAMFLETATATRPELRTWHP